MNVTVSIPDNLAEALAGREDVSRQMLEAFAIENYRQEKLSLGQVAEMLDLSIDETNAFLKKHSVPPNFTAEDISRDRADLEMFLKK